MKKILTAVLVSTIFLSSPIVSFAQEPYYQEDIKMSQDDINLYKYKMEKITIKQQLGKWTIIQGINYELTDMQLLKLVNSQNIAIQRMKDVENKQNLGGALTVSGIIAGAAGGLFLSNIFKVDNGNYYGIGGIVLGLGLIAVGNMISPIVSDETDHIIDIQQAKDAAESYNAEVRKRLNITNDTN